MWRAEDNRRFFSRDMHHGMTLLPLTLTLCEMGSANGALMSMLGSYVMPGGKLVATAPIDSELAATRAAVEVHAPAALVKKLAKGLVVGCMAFTKVLVVLVVVMGWGESAGVMSAATAVGDGATATAGTQRRERFRKVCAAYATPLS